MVIVKIEVIIKFCMRMRTNPIKAYAMTLNAFLGYVMYSKRFLTQVLLTLKYESRKNPNTLL